jgi:hypothetical protein
VTNGSTGALREADDVVKASTSDEWTCRLERSAG